MRTFSHLLDLITSDALTLTAAGVLAIAVVGLLLVISWPSSDARPAATPGRSLAARDLAASGLPPIDIARRTGLSRDGLALLLTTPPRGARQSRPGAAGSSLFGRLRRGAQAPAGGPQVVA